MKDDRRVVKLPSGAELKVSMAPFADSKDLYQAFLTECSVLNFDGAQEMDFNFFKDIFCIGLSSKLIEEKLWVCMGRCLYNGVRITPDTFEPAKARDDYGTVMIEIAKENIEPFTKSLYAQYSHIIGELLNKENPK